MIVYLITNLTNGKIYVGQTTQPLRIRWWQHIYYAKAGKKMVLFDAIRKYGETSFSIKEIDRAASLQELNELEIFHIEHLRANVQGVGYNSTSGGAGTTPLSQETREKMGKAIRSRFVTAETRAKISASSKGKKLSTECKAKLSARCGHPLSPEHAAKFVMSQLGKRLSLETKKKISQNSGTRKLAPDQVRAIRLDPRTHREISLDYAVCRTTITAIKTGRIGRLL